MQALILAGGSGTRFWPLSRRHRPKQLLALDGELSLLQATVERLAPLIPAADIWVCTTRQLADAVREQLPDVPADQVLCEPEGRNTAPAIGWSLATMASATPSSATAAEAGRDIVAVLPSDHRFADPAVLRDRLERAAAIVERDDRVMTLGVTPRWAETGYGYLELGEPLGATDGVGEDAHQVARFREKPDAETAKTYVDSGRFLWNAGIFVFRGPTLLDHLRRFEPSIGEGLDAILDQPERADALYGELKSISIDYAVMERLDDLGTLPLDGGWSDLGSWQALGDELDRAGTSVDDQGNATHGDILAIDARDNLLWADAGQVAVVGVEGLVVVRTGDTVLVVPRERSQDVKAIVERLRADGRDDLL
ncbi:MAG: mannose-1-phosphate guanylyltransferase [Acidobacteriota bacterium]